MKVSRTINPSDIRLLYFGTKDVLEDKSEQESRETKLKRAMSLSNCEAVPISLYLKLPNGETVETHSDLVDFAEDFVMLKGGHILPVRAILDVETMVVA